jgi:UrcA family protein
VTALATFRAAFATVRHKTAVARFGRSMLSTRRVATQKETFVKAQTTSTGLRSLIATAILGSLALGLSVVAAADPNAESRTVKFADLDMSNPAAAHVLYRRIRAAAQVVCSYYFLPTDTDKARCVRDATADAVTKINQPALSAVYGVNYKIAQAGALVSQSR